MSDIRLPTDRQFVEDLVLQRTAAFIALGGGPALNHWFATGEKHRLYDFLAANDLMERFLQATIAEIGQEADALMASVPAQCFGCVVSIGPGNGLLELGLLRATAIERLLLVDIEQSTTHRHGYGEGGSGYASLAATREFLVANGVDERRIETCNPRREPLPDFEFDLAVSILSMGFHYPCDEYADFIEGNAHGGSHIVLDRRRGVADAGFERLARTFRSVHVTSRGKYDRVVMAR